MDRTDWNIVVKSILIGLGIFIAALTSVHIGFAVIGTTGLVRLVFETRQAKSGWYFVLPSLAYGGCLGGALVMNLVRGYGVITLRSNIGRLHGDSYTLCSGIH
jgi:hypothetical protein